MTQKPKPIIKVREATRKDIPEMVKISKSKKLNYNPADHLITKVPSVAFERTAGLFSDPDCIIYVAEVDNEIVGTGYITTTGHISTPYISTSIVGVGEALLVARIKKAKTLDLPYVSISPTDSKMMKLIKKHGFQHPEPHSRLWLKSLNPTINMVK